MQLLNESHAALEAGTEMLVCSYRTVYFQAKGRHIPQLCTGQMKPRAWSTLMFD